MKSDQRKEKEVERNTVRINRRRGFVWKICAASETCLLIAKADILSFVSSIYKMKYSCYQHSFVILGLLVYWVVVEKCAAQQKKIGHHPFQK